MMHNWWVTEVLALPRGQMVVAAIVIWTILSITLHELAHGWAAIRCGDTTPIDSGHMTWNPMVHMGLTSFIALALAGMAWGAMPIDPTRMRGKYAYAFVAAAGPAMNFLLAAICIVLAGVLKAVLPPMQGQSSTLNDLLLFFIVGGFQNVGLGLFNLLPAPPLDGSRIVSNFVPAYRNLMESEAGGFLSFIAFALAFIFGGKLAFEIGGDTVQAGSNLVLSALRAAGVRPIAALGPP
jgi:Zn-dependent protease